MNIISEERIETNISLSNTQKYVLTKLIASETGQMAYEAVSRGRNIVASRDNLTKANLMTFSDGETPQQEKKFAAITDQGTQVLKDEGLVDEMGQLTDTGNQYAYAESPEDIEALGAQNTKPEMPQQVSPDMKPAQPMGDGQGSAGMGGLDVGGGEAPMESWSMISEMNDALNESKFLKKTREL